MTIEATRENPERHPRRHVVLLGAGASRATCLNGDKHGKKLPLMNDLPDILGCEWQRLKEKARVPDGDFEFQYSWIKSKPDFAVDLTEVEMRLAEYFRQIELPDEPTIYDYLLLGLRPSDVVATFNWDPLLLQVYARNRGVCPLPDVRFLHGCVSYRTCPAHDTLGSEGMICPACHSTLQAGPIIYPEADKDYTKDSCIRRDWEVVQTAIRDCFHITVFGYSAPKTDFNARKMLLAAWGREETRGFCHVEFIDIAKDEALWESWEAFIPYDHMMHVCSFFDSSIARWPRRTFEWKSAASFYGMPSEFIGAFKPASLSALQDWFRELSEEEN